MATISTKILTSRLMAFIATATGLQVIRANEKAGAPENDYIALLQISSVTEDFAPSNVKTLNSGDDTILDIETNSTFLVNFQAQIYQRTDNIDAYDMVVDLRNYIGSPAGVLDMIIKEFSILSLTNINQFDTLVDSTIEKRVIVDLVLEFAQSTDSQIDRAAITSFVPFIET